MSGSGTTAAALLAALGVVALLRPAASQAGSFPVPQTCRAEEFFDTAGVTCSSCIIDAVGASIPFDPILTLQARRDGLPSPAIDTFAPLLASTLKFQL